MASFYLNHLSAGPISKDRDILRCRGGGVGLRRMHYRGAPAHPNRRLVLIRNSTTRVKSDHWLDSPDEIVRPSSGRLPPGCAK